MTMRTITLTGRPPVQIDEEAWSVLADAKDEAHDGQIRSQANRVSSWAIRVRTLDANADGDFSGGIVSAVYSYTSAWQGARCRSVKHGVILSSGATAADACAAIKEVCARMGASEHHDEDAARWPQLGDDCIADMPVEVL